MDPKACIRDALDHYEGGETAEALHCLRNYFEWRLRGGLIDNDQDALDLMFSIAVSLEGE